MERHYAQYVDEVMENAWRTHMASQGSSAELKKFLSDYQPDTRANPDKIASPQEVAAAFGVKLTGM